MLGDQESSEVLKDSSPSTNKVVTHYIEAASFVRIVFGNLEHPK